MRGLSCVLFMCICLCLSGCSLSNSKPSVQKDYIQALKEKTNTMLSEEEVTQAAIETYNENTNGWQKFWNKAFNVTRSLDERAVTYVQKHDKLDASYRAKLEVDMSTEDRLAVTSYATTFVLSKYLPLVLLLLLIVGLIIAKMHISSHSTARARALPNKQFSEPVYKESAVNYERLLRKLCSENKLIYEDELSKFNGNARMAVEAINLL